MSGLRGKDEGLRIIFQKEVVASRKIKIVPVVSLISPQNSRRSHFPEKTA